MAAVQLITKRRPMLASTMTRAELVKEAEHMFPNPSAIVARMIAELRGDLGQPNDALRKAGHPVLPGIDAECRCPACGSSLYIE